MCSTCLWCDLNVVSGGLLLPLIALWTEAFKLSRGVMDLFFGMVINYICHELYAATKPVFVGLYQVVIRFPVHWVFQLHSIFLGLYDISILDPSGLDFPISITLGEVLIDILPTLVTIFLESLQEPPEKEPTWEEREEELRRIWEDQFQIERSRLKMERQEVEWQQKQLEAERKELETDRQKIEHEYMETREMNLRQWRNDKQALDEAEAKARNVRMVEHANEERRYIERKNKEIADYHGQRDRCRNVEEREYRERRDLERMKWEQLDIKVKMKWCQMRLPVSNSRPLPFNTPFTHEKFAQTGAKNSHYP